MSSAVPAIRPEPSITLPRGHRREPQSPCRTFFPPFIAVFGRFLARTSPKPLANQSLGSSALFSPFENGENGENGGASHRRRNRILYLVTAGDSHVFKSVTSGNCHHILRPGRLAAGDFLQQPEEPALALQRDGPVHPQRLEAVLEALAAHAVVEVAPARARFDRSDEALGNLGPPHRRRDGAEGAVQ